MTPNEKNIMRSLVAVAWADGKLEGGEFGVIDGLLCGFGASDEEEHEILEYAKTRRSLTDIPLHDLTREDRETLLANAALLTLADGEFGRAEARTLADLAERLTFSETEVKQILRSAKEGAERISQPPGSKRG